MGQITFSIQHSSSPPLPHLQKYLSSLRKKTQGETSEQAPQAGRKKLSLGGDASDISLTDSSEQRSSARAPATRSKFLKARPSPQPTPQAPQVAVKLGTAVGGSALQRSAALAEASRLTGKYEKQKRREKRGKERKMSDSEVSAPSTDSDALKKRGSGGGAEALYAKSTRAKLGYLTDEESASIGKDGGKFLRKKKEKEEAKDGPLTPKTKKQLRFAGIADDDEEATPRSPGKSPKSPSSHSSSLRSGEC